jgi:alpha-ketoglutarate-dependent taurine dioxygenase
MIDLEELQSRGWTLVPGVSSRASLIELAHLIGSPVPHPNGELVKEVRVMPTESAKQRTLSSRFGTDSFPLHTDTAFWRVPARYLILRVIGDTRRPTTVLPFRSIINNRSNSVLDWAERSVWYLRTPSQSAYCSMRFRNGTSTGWRFDAQCMFPANSSARQMTEAFENKAIQQHTEEIDWSIGCAAVISNWAVLHGRGPAPIEERERVLERIYVGGEA